MGRPAIDVLGQIFGKLTVTKKIGSGDHYGKKAMLWECTCICGKTKICAGGELRTGNVTSCGCVLLTDEFKYKARKHNMCYSYEYNIRMTMIQRCTNPNHPRYADYGGRGITVCARWLESFENFFEDMCIAPQGYEIDRINNNLGYYKENCRWATMSQNARNKRNNRQVTYKGETKPLVAWCEELNLYYDTIKSRLLSGWSDHDALATPIRQKSVVAV